VIAYVRGVVADLAPDEAVVEVGGVGLSVKCSPATIATLRIGQPARVPTSLVVREDSLTLFGFADEDEREVFTILQTASGVGPRLALAMLGVHRPDALRRAVAEGDLRTLQQVPGIGRKGAERIVVELKDRLGLPTGSGAAQSPLGRGNGGAGDAWQGQVHAALLGLGWSTREADDAVAEVAPLARDQETPDVAALLRAALRSLDRSGA
jgi:Holliday junction DNA helicase RuvA